jgi:hypothetical protein
MVHGIDHHSANRYPPVLLTLRPKRGVVMDHDSEKHAIELLQCLAQDKKHLGLLIGAGCPSALRNASNEALIPDISGLTKTVKEQVCSCNLKENWNNICQHLADDGNSDPNIENILSRVRGLRDYIGSTTVGGLDRAALDAIEKKVCGAIIDCVRKDLPNKSTPYHRLASWIGAIDRSYPVEIFTTNYDLLIEQALEDLRVPFFDGFVGSRQPFFDPYAVEFDTLPPRWARVWKIHGSINWRSQTLDEKLIVWRSDPGSGGEVVIHPSHLKYEQSRKMPYLAMMDHLRKFLSTPSSCMVIVGYSFGDQHLNDIMLQSLQGSPTTSVFGLLYGPLTNYKEATRLAKERNNLCLYATDAAVIGTKEAPWKNSRDKPDSDLPVEVVKWTKGPNDDDPWTPESLLGDFATFGTFLQDISGRKDIGG